MQPVIHAEGLGKRYTGGFRGQPVEALRDFDLSVGRGEVFGLLGPNGAGKTTFIKAVLGIIRPTTGAGTLLGQPIGNPEARRGVGYLPEQHRFPGHLTARQALDTYARLAGMSTGERRSESTRLLGRVMLSEWADVKTRKYSKGMMQRLGLAQALMGSPDLVILDEPTDGVDPIGRREIREVVSWLASIGVTIFLNSHLLSEVEMVCTRVAIMNKGKLVSEGSVAELTASPSAYRVLGSPVEAVPEGITHDNERPWTAYSVQAENPEELTRQLRRLMDAGALIREVHPARRSLEQAFVEIVGEAGLDALRGAPDAAGPDQGSPEAGA